MKKYGRIIALVMSSIFIFSSCKKPDVINSKTDPSDTTEMEETGVDVVDETTPVEDSFIRISKTDAGDLVIEITDEVVAAFEEKVEKLAATSDYMFSYESKDQIFDIAFYSSEAMAGDYAGEEDFASAIAKLRVYPYGAEFLDYKRVFADSVENAYYGEEWDYFVDMYGTGFRTEGETLTLIFKGSCNLLDGTRAYMCDRHKDDDTWEMAKAPVSVGSTSGESVAAAGQEDADVSVLFLDDNTVYVILRDDELSEDTEDFYYRVNFGDERNLDGASPFGSFFLESRFNDSGTYPISMLSENRLISETAEERSFEMIPLNYYMEDNGDPDYPKRAAADELFGNAEVYNGYLTMSFSYEDLRDTLTQYSYVSVVKGWPEGELMSWYNFGDVAKLEDYDPYSEVTIEPIKEEYVRPYDAGIFEPETPYYFVLSTEIYGPVANGMAWTQIKGGEGYYPAPPFVGAWGFHPEIDTERYGHAISTLLESYDEFGNLVQSVIRFEYDTVEDLQWSYIDWHKIYYPFNEYGVDEPSMEYVNPEYYEISREETLEKVAADAVCLGVYENYIYYDMMGIYWLLDRYGSCFERHNVSHVIEDYRSDGSSESFFEAGLNPFEYTAVIPDGNVADSWPYENSTEIRVDLIRNDSIYYAPNNGAESQAASFVHDTTCKLDSIGGYMGFVYGEAPAGYMKGYSYVKDLRRVLNFVDQYSIIRR